MTYLCLFYFYINVCLCLMISRLSHSFRDNSRVGRVLHALARLRLALDRLSCQDFAINEWCQKSRIPCRLGGEKVRQHMYVSQDGRMLSHTAHASFECEASGCHKNRSKPHEPPSLCLCNQFSAHPSEWHLCGGGRATVN